MAGGEFDPIEFINKVYAESTLYELNDALAVMARSLEKTRQKSKELITAHFSKFVLCRTILEDIWKDMQEKGLDTLDTAYIDKSLRGLIDRYRSITKGIAPGVVTQKYDRKRLQYQNEFSDIFNMKEDLEKQKNAPEQFAAIYNRALKSLERVKGSKFMQMKFQEIAPLISEYLNGIYEIIVTGNLSFEEACRYFDLYFSVSGGKSDQKIMSTLLVGFKAATMDTPTTDSEYIDYLFVSFARLMPRVDATVADEGIVHFFDRLSLVLPGSNRMFVKNLICRIHEFIGGITLPNAARQNYMLYFSDYKLKAYKALIAGESLGTATSIFEYMVEFFDEQETTAARDALLDHTIEYIKTKCTHNYEYLKAEATEATLVKRFLGARSSGHNKKLTAFLRDNRFRVIEALAGALADAIKTKDNAYILMEVTRIMGKSPEFYQDIVFEAKNHIIKSPVIHAFLSRYIKVDPPTLTGKDKEDFVKLKYQFGYLIDS